MSSNIEREAEKFAEHYAALFSDPAASSSKDVGALTKKIGECYRPGMTMFTNGKVSRFEVSYSLFFYLARWKRHARG